MAGTPLRRKIVLLLLATVLTASGAWAAEPLRSAPGADPVALDLAGRLWRWLTGLWNEAGCELDPDGRCITPPNGGPGSTSQADAGCELDPNGRCIG